MSTTVPETHPMPEASPRYSTDLTIPSDPCEARRIQQAIEESLKSHRYSEHDVFAIKLAVEEALVNAIKHGNQMDRSKNVRVAYHVAADRFDCLIADEGTGFQPDDVPDPTAPENLERPSGRGLMLMRHYMTAVDYNDRGNVVSMCKLRNGKK